jgi:hypothetical protein
MENLDRLINIVFHLEKDTRKSDLLLLIYQYTYLGHFVGMIL